MQRDPSLAERDARVARLGEASLRLMSDSVAPATLERARRAIEASPDVYPWEEVVDELLRDPVEPTALFQAGLVAQRDWIERGGAPKPPVAAPIARAPVTTRSDGPRRAAPRKSASFYFKTFVAMLIVRGTFYGIMIVALLVALILLRERYPGFDIYQLADDGVAWFRSLFAG